MSRYINCDLIVKNPMLHTWKKADILRAIKEAPTADVVEVKHGEWGFDGMGWTCSQCGEYALSHKAKIQVHSVYCPNCGAKMDGESEDTKVIGGTDVN